MNSSKLRILFHLAIAILPSSLKKILYRKFFGYKIGRNVRIGFSVLCPRNCTIGDNVQIGHLNVFIGTDNLEIGEFARVGHLNIFRGGTRILLGRYSEVFRLNEINSIPDPLISNIADPTFELGDGSVITASHKIDFTDSVKFGRRVILGGRNSSLWTHNRQQTKPIVIGNNCYLGSEIRFAPGVVIPSNSVVGIGSVLTKSFVDEFTLIAGVPAKVVKELDAESRNLVANPTRLDLPEEI